ncbi:MAG: hypothetical protein WCL70_10555 [Paludibacter sp.]
MKRFFFPLLLICISAGVFSQVVENKDIEKTSSITVGILQGGGSLVGADFETLLSKQLGAQIGAGYLGFGGGINYHFKPSIHSSFLSLQYWHQGVGSTYTQSMIGPTFVYRAPKWFTAQIGLGYVLEHGPAWTSAIGNSPVILL